MRRVRWAQAFRLIPTRYPPVPLFERLGDPSQWETIADIESLTNPRAREELGDIAVVPAEQRVSGPGATWVMAPFVHRRSSRFSDGSYGVYYAARRRPTAIAETRFHMARFYAASSELPLDVEMRVLVGAVDDRLHDLRGGDRRWSAVLDPDNYAAGWQLGAKLRAAGSRGLVYPSVRDQGGQCFAALTPRATGLPASAGVLSYHWDGERVARVFDYAAGEWL
ncbi:MAG: RES family NAD+ phosphorylase [Planctomycetota bacterium]